MDITKVFEACVKAVCVKKKDLLPKKNILPKSKKTHSESFNSHAQGVMQSISQLRDFLIKYQTDYLSEYSHLPSMSGKLTDAERDQIDSDSQIFMKSCSNAIESLKKEATLQNNSQSKLHSVAVVELLEIFLKDVCRLYSQLRACRVKLAVDRKGMAQLSYSKQKICSKREGSLGARKISSNEENNQNILSTIKANSSKQIKIGLGEKKNEQMDSKQSTVKVSKGLESSITNIEQEDEDISEKFKFTKEETQLFKEENERLYLELNTTMKEVRNIEGKVIEISQLQEIFQEKVLAQSAQIQSIHNSAVATTENVKDGNEQIRDAIKNSATFRVWILFFLVMCTFSLLFLDWYNY